MWGFHPTLLSLEGCKSPSMTMHALTSSAPSMHGHGAAALLAEQQSKIIAASASPPPPAIPAECCAEQALLQPPHTKSCLDIYKPRISQIEIGAGGGWGLLGSEMGLRNTEWPKRGSHQHNSEHCNEDAANFPCKLWSYLFTFHCFFFPVFKYPPFLLKRSNHGFLHPVMHSFCPSAELCFAVCRS